MRTPRVCVVGGGVSGIGIAAKLKLAGIETFDLFERSNDVGGVWRANSYPGIRIDVPARFYQYRFAPNPDWSHVYADGPEIHRYLRRVAEDLGVMPHVQLNTRVTEGEWSGREWIVRTDGGSERAYDFVFAGTGVLVHPRYPDIPGLGTFEGACFHSAEWDHSVPLEGRRIGVVGTGSTGVQLIKGLAGVAGHLELYQRTAPWIFPSLNHRYTAATKWAYRRFPWLNAVGYRFHQLMFEGSFGRAVVKRGLVRAGMSAMCRLHLRRVRDPELRRRFTPADAEPMCKRLVMATGFYELFERPDVELVDTGIERVEPRGIRTRDGELHELDVIALATGFQAQDYLRPMELIGPGGLRLSELWDGAPFAYRSVALPGFPNVMLLVGPHSPVGSNSVMMISETQEDFALKLIERWRRREFDAVAPTHDATVRYNEQVRSSFQGTTWATGCRSWYHGEDGVPHVWPWLPKEHRRALATLEPSDWEFIAAPADELVASGDQAGY